MGIHACRSTKECLLHQVLHLKEFRIIKISDRTLSNKRHALYKTSTLYLYVIANNKMC